MYHHQRQTKLLLPSKKDISKLWTYINENRWKFFKLVQKKYSFFDWKQLMAHTLVSIEVFNRRRPVESERIMINDFEARTSIDESVDREAYQRLSVKEKEYARKYVRFEIRGKLNRTVLVIIQKDVEECILEIIKHRKEAGIPAKNEYILGLPSFDETRPKFIRACGLVREYSEKCGAEKPITLRTTKLRKQVATTCLKLNLNEQYVSDLANFMGHTDPIHKKHYRMTVALQQILGITKLLEAAKGDNDDEESDSDIFDEESGEQQQKMNFEVSMNETHKKSFKKTKIRRAWIEKEKSILEQPLSNILVQMSCLDFEKFAMSKRKTRA